MSEKVKEADAAQLGNTVRTVYRQIFTRLWSCVWDCIETESGNSSL